MNRLIPLITFSLFIGSVGCVPPSEELVRARAAYGQASKGPAQEHIGPLMKAAKELLLRAETSFEQNGRGFEARDDAYVAERKAQQAMVAGRMHDKEQREGPGSKLEALREGRRLLGPELTTSTVSFNAGS